MVCAQSSITATPRPSHSATSRSMSAMWPRMWESSRCRAPLAFALRSRSSRSMTRSGVISTSTCSAPACSTAPGTGARVKAFISTRSPGRTPAPSSARNIALPQEFTATQKRRRTSAANSSSSNEASEASPWVSP